METVPIKNSKEMSSAGLWQYSAQYSQNQAHAHLLSSECCAEYLSPRRCEMALYITVYTDEEQYLTHGEERETDGLLETSTPLLFGLLTFN